MSQSTIDLNACKWINPRSKTGMAVTGSIMASSFISFSCVKYNSSQQQFVMAWQTMLRSVAEPIIKRLQHLMDKNPKNPIKILHKVVTEISDQGKCYSGEERNFIYDLLIYGKCNCACGSIMIYAIAETFFNPRQLKYMYFVFVPRHVFLVYQLDDINWVNIESTKYEQSKTSNLSIGRFNQVVGTPFSIIVCNDPVFAMINVLMQSYPSHDDLDRMALIFSDSSLCQLGVFGTITCITCTIRLFISQAIKTKQYKNYSSWNELMKKFPSGYNEKLRQLWAQGIDTIVKQTKQANPKVTTRQIVRVLDNLLVWYNKLNYHHDKIMLPPDLYEPSSELTYLVSKSLRR